MTRKATAVVAFLVALLFVASQPVLAIVGLGSATPNVGTTAGGTVVHIVALDALTGTVEGVDFGGVPATNVQLVDLFTIRATTPAHAAGTVDVHVRVQTLGLPLQPLTQLLTLTNGYTYVSPPTLTSISPVTGSTGGGTVVTVTGANFRSPMTVRFGANAGTNIVLNSATQLTVTTPPSPAGAVNVIVTNVENESASLTNGFTYAAGATPPSTPTITGVNPTSGPQSGNTPITITGTQFQTGVIVTMCGVQVPVVSATATTIDVITPPCPSARAATIAISNPDGGSTSTNTAFTYNTTSVPTISGISPGNGSPNGGTPVLISGTQFLTGATVTIGCGPALTPIVVNSATISALTPACPSGSTGNVVVTNPDGGVATLVGGFIFGTSAPTLSAITPNTGSTAGGTTVTLAGTNFASGATVSLGGQPATNVQLVTTGVLTAVTPPAAYAGSVSVVLTNRDGSTATLANAFTYTSPSGPGDPTDPTDPYPNPNPNAHPTDPNDTDGDGLSNDCETKFGLDPNSAVGADGAAGDPDNDGRSNSVECNGGTHPRGFFTRYLAEGATGPFFDMFIALLNARDQDARTLVRYQMVGGTTTPEPSDYLIVPAQRRRTINPENTPVLAQTSFSTIVESDVQLIAERNMQWGGGHYGSHSETSSASPSTIWYFAEGATHGTFNLFYLFQNPNDADTTVTVTYMRPAPQPPVVKTYAVAANSRSTIWVDAEGPELEMADLSARVESTRPIMAERVMYADAAGEVWAAGHASAGVTEPKPGWFFAEGATGAFFNTFFLIANPNTTAITVRATYLLGAGSAFTKDYIVEASSRFTIGAHADDPRLANQSFSTKFETLNAEGMIVERAMWWPATLPWIEAHNSAGVTTTGTEWAVAQGQLAGDDAAETYVLVANTSATTANLRVRALAEDDTVVERFFSVPANARFNIRMMDAFPEMMHKRFGVVVASLGPRRRRSRPKSRCMPTPTASRSTLVPMRRRRGSSRGRDGYNSVHDR